MEQASANNYLNAWEYCQQEFYLEYILGEMEINEHIIRGNHLHCNIAILIKREHQSKKKLAFIENSGCGGQFAGLSA